MPKFSEILAALGITPKTLDQAKQPLDQGKQALAEVAALFAAAGLDLDAMRAAGPDALKAHIEAVGAKDGELAKANERIAELEASAVENDEALAVALEDIEHASALFASVGFEFSAESKPEDFRAAFESHAKKSAAVELAKTGTLPVAVVSEAQAEAPKFSSDAEKWNHFAKLKKDNPEAAKAFYDAHIKRGK